MHNLLIILLFLIILKNRIVIYKIINDFNICKTDYKNIYLRSNKLSYAAPKDSNLELIYPKDILISHHLLIFLKNIVVFNGRLFIGALIARHRVWPTESPNISLVRSIAILRKSVNSFIHPVLKTVKTS